MKKSPAIKRDPEIKKAISGIVGVFSDPIVVYPGGWGEAPPARVKEAVTLERMFMEMKGRKGEQVTGTDAEAMYYLSTAAMNAPLGSDWTDIYMYVFSKVAKFHNWNVEKDLIQEKISDYHLGMLQHLKRWIYERRIRERKSFEQAERRTEKADQLAAQKEMYPQLFDLSTFEQPAGVR